MLPSLIYTVFLASALTVSAAPVDISQVTGNKGIEAVGNTLQGIATGNSIHDVANVNPEKVPTPESVKDGVPSDPTKGVKDTIPSDPTKAAKDAVPANVEGSLPKTEEPSTNIQIVHQTLGDKVTFQKLSGTNFNIVDAICCSNVEEVLASHDVEKCEVVPCVMEILAFDDEKLVGDTTRETNPATGIMDLTKVKALGDIPHVSDSTLDTASAKAEVDKVVVTVTALKQTVEGENPVKAEEPAKVEDPAKVDEPVKIGTIGAIYTISIAIDITLASVGDGVFAPST